MVRPQDDVSFEMSLADYAAASPLCSHRSFEDDESVIPATLGLEPDPLEGAERGDVLGVG